MLQTMDKLLLHIESLIFASEKPINIEDITSVLEETLEVIISPTEVENAIEQIKEKYSDDNFAIEIILISGGYTFMTKGAYHLTISNYLRQTTNKKLSKAALETLAIVAYKQPVSKSEIESIRGVNCDYAVQKLLDKELIEIRGRSESVGKPLLYGASEKFFDYFGINGIQDLPKLKDFELPENTIGNPDEIDHDVPVLIDGEAASYANANADEDSSLFEQEPQIENSFDDGADSQSENNFDQVVNHNTENEVLYSESDYKKITEEE
jgi:segregation and condensation protein B